MDSPKPAIPPSTRFLKYWLPVFTILAIQFSFSTNAFSSSETSRFIIPILKVLMPHSDPGRLVFWHHVIRKAAHLTEYCVLGVFTLRAIAIDIPHQSRVGILTVLFVAAAALGDEFHQSFVPSRGSSIVDVGYDFIGGVIAILLVWVWRSTRVAEQ